MGEPRTPPNGAVAAITSPADLAERLCHDGYLPDEGLVMAAFLAVRMQRPLFLEGEPGVGKTTFAYFMAKVLGAQSIRLQCHGGIDASQALYDWNFPKQILTLRAAAEGEPASVVPKLYTEEFLVRRPILAALDSGPTVLLIDEIDRADDEFEACLLEVLENNSVTIPEIGTIRAKTPPLVILTSNRTREVHDALKRRCLYHWIAHPERDREMAILRRRVDNLPEGLAEAIADAMQRVRAAEDLVKPPGIAESIDLAQAVVQLNCTVLTPEVVDATLSTVVKHHDDWAVVRARLLPGQ
jgi:MoxR-like ATPase